MTKRILISLSAMAITINVFGSATWPIQSYETDTLATPVCPFTMTGTASGLRNVIVRLYSGASCSAQIGANGWQRSGSYTPTAGSYSLSNEALTAAFSSQCAATASMQVSIVEHPGNAPQGVVCMAATCSANLWTCTGSGYTLALT